MKRRELIRQGVYAAGTDLKKNGVGEVHPATNVAGADNGERIVTLSGVRGEDAVVSVSNDMMLERYMWVYLQIGSMTQHHTAKLLS